MVELSVAYWIFNSITSSMMLLMILINFFILYKYTLEFKTWRKLEYQLILVRVTIDAFNGITGLTYITLSVITMFSDVIPYEVSFTFGIVGFNLMEIRCFLAAIIAIERVLATTIPIKFYHYRNRISNIPIFIFIISTGIACDVVLFGYCDFKVAPVEGCTNFQCATPLCFQKYWSTTRIVYSSINFIFSVILCYKLLCLSWKQSKVSTDLRKANLLSLTDGLSTLIFELLPSLAYTYGFIDVQGLGPIIGAFRSTGRVIEAFVMVKLMKRDTVVAPRVSVTARNNLN